MPFETRAQTIAEFIVFEFITVQFEGGKVALSKPSKKGNAEPVEPAITLNVEDWLLFAEP